MKESKIIIIMVVAVVAGLVGGAVMFTMSSQQPAGTGDLRDAAQERASQQSEAPEVKEKISYDGVEGKNALELLKQEYKVETDTFDGVGEFVTSINGVAADEKRFWALYVNDKQSQVGAGDYITKSGEKITWKLEAIQ